MSNDIQSIAVTVARIEEKQDAILQRIDDHLDADKTVHADHEKRVRSLEKSKWMLTGISATVAAAIAAAFKYGGGP